MKLDKDYKNDIDTSFKESDYIGEKLIVRIVIIAILLVVFFAAIGFVYHKITVDANRDIFKHSSTFTETAVAFLAKEYREYNLADTEDSRKAIMAYVVNRYPNLDLNLIENDDLKSFYKQCLRGGN